VLRPLDLQIRNRSEKRRGGGNHHPRNGTSGLSVAGSEIELEQRKLRARYSKQEYGRGRGAFVDHARCCKEIIRRFRPGFRCAEEICDRQEFSTCSSKCRSQL